MDRIQKITVVRKYNDSKYFRSITKNREFVSTTNSVLDCPSRNLAELDCGSTVAARPSARTNTIWVPRLFARCSMNRVSAALAGLLACATATPAAAHMADAPPTKIAPAEIPQNWVTEAGSASWYAASRHPRRTASGARYDQNSMTAAHPWLPFGSKVRVTRRDTGHSIVVTITDRLPSKRHVIDLSVGAAKRLGMLRQGTTQVALTPA